MVRLWADFSRLAWLHAAYRLAAEDLQVQTDLEELGGALRDELYGAVTDVMERQAASLERQEARLESMPDVLTVSCAQARHKESWARALRGGCQSGQLASVPLNRSCLVTCFLRTVFSQLTQQCTKGFVSKHRINSSLIHKSCLLAGA
eukprot:scaffold167175_cov21-Tisochrysis_lutea.AAC.2